MRRAELIGKKFGRLTVLAFSHIHNGFSYWMARCDCGTEKVFSVANLGRGTKSCGCLQNEIRTKNGISTRTHGMSHTKTYQAWCSMLKRADGCQPRYKRDYTDRGITVDLRWKSFENFFVDMGECPNGMTLERKDNDLGYFHGNCIWATMLQQNRNRRTTVLDQEKVRFIRQSIDSGAEVARQLGVSVWVVYNVRQHKSWKNIA